MIEAQSQAPNLLYAARSRLRESRTAHAESWDAAGVFAIRAASAALLFATQIALARWLGAAEYGIFVAAWTCVLVLGGLCGLGFSTAMMRLAPQYTASGDFASFHGLLSGGRAVAVAASSAIALVGFAVFWLRGDFADPARAVPMTLALLCLPVFALTDVQDGLGRGQRWTFEAIGPHYVLRPLALMLLIPLMSAFGAPDDAASAMALMLATLVLATALQTGLIARRIRSAIPPRPPAYHFGRWFGISLPLLAGSICDLTIQNADVLLLAALRPSEETGLYYAAAKTAGLALFIHYAVGTAYAGRIAAAHALNERAEVCDLVSKAVRWTFIPTAAVMAAILLVGYPVLASFGETFTGAYPLMFILAVGILAKAATGPADTILNMLGHQRASAVSIGLAAVLGIALCVILIPLWGIVGAAVATSAALIASSALNWMAARRLEGLNLFILANLPHSAAAPVAAHDLA
jgi:O-antigen/teichoic acid export membrane protein